MNLSDIKRQFDYMEWANDLAMTAAANLPDESLHRETGISHGSIFGTLLHMAGAEWIWLERWHGHSPGKAEAWASWTRETCADLPTLKERWGAIRDRRADELLRRPTLHGLKCAPARLQCRGCVHLRRQQGAAAPGLDVRRQCH